MPFEATPMMYLCLIQSENCRDWGSSGLTLRPEILPFYQEVLLQKISKRATHKYQKCHGSDKAKAKMFEQLLCLLRAIQSTHRTRLSMRF